MLFLLIQFLLFVPFSMHAGQDSEMLLKEEIGQLEMALEQVRAKQNYIVIDTQHNTLQIWQKDHLLHEATCATGSGKVLLHPNKQTRWQFTTPRGRHRIQRKVEDPIWAKPVWAFVEDGSSIPTLPWEFRRLDTTTLGKYALELGDGYEIHGTLYPTLLGRSITHGCIRLNDEDLAQTFDMVATGNHVYIY